MVLPDKVTSFFEKQGFVIVSTIDNKNGIHSSIKGIVSIEQQGNIYLMDLYMGATCANLKRNNKISITAVDEKHFIGYALKGKARIIEREEIKSHIIEKWDSRINKRISSRLIRHIREEEHSSGNPEADLPLPKYLIIMEVDEIVDLSPRSIRG